MTVLRCQTLVVLFTFKAFSIMANMTLKSEIVPQFAYFIVILVTHFIWNTIMENLRSQTEYYKHIFFQDKSDILVSTIITVEIQPLH